MSISELFPVTKNRPQIPITKSSTFKMSKQPFDGRKYPCTICQKKFKAKNHLREHMTLHSDIKNYKCDKCQFEFKAPGAWRNHMRKVHGFECPHCKKLFSTLTLLKQHRMSKHKDFLKQKLEDEVGLKEIQIKSEQQKITNSTPKKTTTSAPKSIVKKIIAKSRLNVNTRTNNKKVGKFVCNECGFKYTLARSLRRHLDTNHKDTCKYICTICDYTTNRSDNFKQHSERHAGGRSLPCSVPSCKFEFFSVKNLRIHVKKFHSREVKKSERISIKKEFKEEEDFDEEETEMLEELDPELGDENGELEENVDESFKFHNNSFLNSTEKSAKLNNSGGQSKLKKTTQLKISTCFSLNSKKEENNSKEKPKTTTSSVSYECCECKIDFPGNTELWDHLLAVHFHKMKNNVKKS